MSLTMVLCCSLVQADVLHLKNGETLRGMVEEGADGYTITLAFGKAVLATVPANVKPFSWCDITASRTANIFPSGFIKV